MRIARVFPKRTRATPKDDWVFTGGPPLWRIEADEVHVSCTFTWHKQLAEHLADEWSKYYRHVKLGGPAYGDPGGEFVPGRYLARGYVLTSRGCPRRCSFCLVPEREGALRTIKIQDGSNILDNNLLATPVDHLNAVFKMLERQARRAEFTGGLEARLITESVAASIYTLRPKSVFLAYDLPGTEECLRTAVKRLWRAGFRAQDHRLSCYVLVGHNDDNMSRATSRLEWVQSLGLRPYAMLYRGPEESAYHPKPEWRSCIRRWNNARLAYGIKKGLSL